MPKWMKPSEELPGECEVGDRILAIIRCPGRRSFTSRGFRQIAIIEATETGWENEWGFVPEDAELWAWEKDVCAVADVVGVGE